MPAIRSVAQTLFDRWLSTQGGTFFDRIILRSLSHLVRGLARVADPLVVYNLDGFRLLIPLSHSLPATRKVYPDYGENIGRIAQRVASKYPDMAAIDIGANVGDTLAVMRSRTSFPVLCVDGEKRFFSILEQNSRQFGDVALECAFIGPTSDDDVCLRTVSDRGTASLVRAGEREEGVHVQTLDQLLSRHPGISEKCRLIKIDTDGFDVRIIESSVFSIARLRPVLFFEYDPWLCDRLAYDPFGVFQTLHHAGYERAIFYESIGNYVVSAALDDHELLQDLRRFISTRPPVRYFDIAVFHRQDADLWATIRMDELALTAGRQ